FPMFRAHPLLFQFLLSLIYHVGVSDLAARLLAVGFGLGTVYLTYRVGAELDGRAVGLTAALLMAVMPYAVVVSRQALLDGPMAFFATLALFLLVRFAASERPLWLYATAAALGLTFLSKETGIVFVPATYAFLALSPTIKVGLRSLVVSALVAAAVMAAYPLS